MVSQEQTDYFLEHYGRKCTTITCAVAMPEEPKESDFLKRYGLQGNDYFLYMGRLVQDKNPVYLIMGFIGAGLKDMKLVLCGGADGNDKYEKYLKSLTSDKSVVFTGPIFGADKDAAFRNCYAFCIPSTMEGLPMSLLEAMSYGKVAIASDIPACHEALDNAGIYVPYEDSDALTKAIKDLESNYEDNQWRGDSNRERARVVFSWENTTRKYLQFISAI